MARFARVPIPIPAGVKVEVEGDSVRVSGPKGQLHIVVPGRIRVTKADASLKVERPNDEKESKAMHGLVHRLLTGMIVGVTQGYSKALEIQGVGYRAQAQAD
ncbi:50S ribosomal protein L6, partial [Candidatus Sumerlaeota bacterium]|nr:50S ribosomal protein L6 [Candidatus Sumerlaeota bacterium]